MKRMVLLMVAALMLATETQAQIIVNIRPVMPRRHVMYSPPYRPGYIWVAEDWIPRGRRYAYRGGYWLRAPHRHAHYVPGYWMKHRRGYSWRPGYWR